MFLCLSKTQIKIKTYLIYYIIQLAKYLINLKLLFYSISIYRFLKMLMIHSRLVNCVSTNN